MGLTPAARRDRLPLYCTLLRATAVYCKKAVSQISEKGSKVYRKVYRKYVKHWIYNKINPTPASKK